MRFIGEPHNRHKKTVATLQKTGKLSRVSKSAAVWAASLVALLSLAGRFATREVAPNAAPNTGAQSPKLVAVCPLGMLPDQGVCIPVPEVDESGALPQRSQRYPKQAWSSNEPAPLPHSTGSADEPAAKAPSTP